MTSERSRSFEFAAWLLGVPIFCMILPFGSHAQSPADDGPRYTADGSLLLPEGFRTWIFVGSNLGLSYNRNLTAMTAKEAARVNPPQFHNVYINRTAYSYFLENNRFPEKTILVMELFEATEKEPIGILATGVFDGKRTGIEVAVKNSTRPDRKPTAWAYYDFTDPSDRTKALPVAGAFSDDACEVCHRLHASIDNVWVQFYPALRDKM